MTKDQFRFRALILSMFFMPIAAVAAFFVTQGFYYRELPVLGEIGQFAFENAEGASVTEADFRNKVWIASFLFTSCHEQCPRISEQLKLLQKKLKSKWSIKLVSFSVDPERDTPERLREYAKMFNADPEKWTFLRGPADKTEALLRQSFKVSSGMLPETPQGSMTHSSHFVLVDGNGYIRGYYDSTDESAMKKLMRDAKGLLGGLS